MGFMDTIRLRKTDIQKAINASAASFPSSSWVSEIEERLSMLETLETTITKEFEEAMTAEEVLSANPLLYNRMLFHLDRCETLLEMSPCRPNEKPEKEITELLLWPRLQEVLICRLFAFLINLRGRICRYDTGFMSLHLREYIYLKVPHLFEPFARWMLPRRKSKFRY